MTGHIFIDDEIGVDTTPKMVRDTIALYPEATEFVVHIDSQGGDVYDGYAIGSIIKNLGKPTTAHIGALCASIATFIACSCDKIIMSPQGDFMIHLPTGSMSGTAEELRKGASQLDRIKSELINRYITRTASKGVTREQLSAMLDKETSMSPQEALAMGFIDEVREKLKAVAKLDLTKFNDMTLTKDEAKGMFEALGNKMDAFFKKFKNVVTLTLADGSNITSDAESADALIGSTLMDEQGQPLADGVYETADGIALTVAGGKVTTAEPITSDKKDGDQVAKLQAEIETLKQQLAAKSGAAEAAQAAAVTAQAEIKEFKNLVTSLKTDFDKLKNETFGDNAPPADAPDKTSKGAIEKDPQLEAMAKSYGESYITSRFK